MLFLTSHKRLRFASKTPTKYNKIEIVIRAGCCHNRRLRSLRRRAVLWLSKVFLPFDTFSPQPGNGRGRERDGIAMREGCGKGAGIHIQFPHSRLTPSPKNGTFKYIFALAIIVATTHSGKSLFQTSVDCLCCCFFWLKWAGYLAVAGLNLLAQIYDRISPYGV